MNKSRYRRHCVTKAACVLLFASLLILPEVTGAEPLTTPPDEPIHTPAYIQGKEDLVDVQVTSRMVPFQLLPPTSTDVDIVELLLQLNESLILGYLENLTNFGPRLSGTEACDQASHYIYTTFHDMGLSVRYHNYTDDVVSGSNIEATLYGTNSTNIFIVCAHYDSVAAGPGADDDGSGVAAVLAAAEIMRNYEFTHTIRFVTFSGEEQGLIGSRHYVEDAYNNNDSIVAVFNADMIGFAPSSSDGSKGKIYQNTNSEWIVDYTEEISQLYSEYIGIQLFSQGESSGSDHYYFWKYGYDAVFYHEYNFNDYYHSANDTIANMNITYSTFFSRLILATLAEMAQQPWALLEITDIKGGLGFSTQITNVGNDNANDVLITVNITGGLLGRLNISKTTSNTMLCSQETLALTIMIFRLGKISISVTAKASNANRVTKHATGLLLGPFVLNLIIIS